MSDVWPHSDAAVSWSVGEHNKMHWTTKMLARSLPVVVALGWTAAQHHADEPTSTADSGGESTDVAQQQVPTEVLDAPAVARSAPRLTGDVARVSARTAADPDDVALAAYQRAASIIDGVDRSCRLDWTLLAAIGQVESFHGQINGNRLDEDGVAHPGIVGIALNGRRDTAAIRDSDAGELDGDTRWDRAVGPMQFIPSTWAVVGVDGDDDGQRDPQDIDDAALASAVYLCSGDDDLSTDAGRTTALLRYNASQSYAATVSALADAFAARSDLSDVLTSVSTPVTVPVATLAEAAVAPLKGAGAPSKDDGNGHRGDGQRDGKKGDRGHHGGGQQGDDARGEKGPAQGAQQGGQQGDDGTDGSQDGTDQGAPLGDGPAPEVEPDTDGDGLTDAEEASGSANTAYGNAPTNPSSGDTDGDGLSDGKEVTGSANTTYGNAPTNPNSSDTDADGLPDGDEVAAGTDPLSSDTEDDGLTDLAETQQQTDPVAPDTDGDGLTDGDEVNTHATEPTIVDTDGDSITDGDDPEPTEPATPDSEESTQPEQSPAG